MSGLDTVDAAVRQPDLPQPFLELGLREDEYLRIRQLLGRRPTATELAMYAVMWSEHCSYKSSKVHLRQFADKAPATGVLLAGIGENAGVVDVGEGLAVTFKVESHNHPSYVEPYQGAATGVGGIVRDILTMGARPVAVMDSLRFGDVEGPDTRRLLAGVVAGIGGYGNCLGLPNIGGELGFDSSYAGNPLVNALCVGVLPREQLQHALATGPGNRVILLGAKTGRDGIGGVSVLASATFDADAPPAKRPSVQVGDPFAEKLLIECCLELYGRGLIAGIQDLGGAGLTCATSETASHGGTGMRIQLDAVPLREPSMEPLEVLTSESQERMLAIVEPGRVDEVMALCTTWGVDATDIGAVTPDDRLTVTWHGQLVVDVPPASLADDGPVYHRPLARPADLDALQADDPARLPRPTDVSGVVDAVLALAASPNLCSRAWVTEQYDRYVLGRTVLAAPHDAGVVRLTDDGFRGVALSLDGNGRYSRLDPYCGAQLALSEAYRNVAATGARPLAATNCLNFGSPEDPAVMWQFSETVRGLADGCAALGIPMTGGNVSFYNQTGEAAINPTPVVGVLGLIEDVRRRVPLGFRAPAQLWLLGTTRDEFGGSEWAWHLHRHLGGRPPAVDLAAEQRLAELLHRAAEQALLCAAHDVSDGGLAQALVEGCVLGDVGARVRLSPDIDPVVALFSESAGRAVVATLPAHASALQCLASECNVPCTPLGEVGGTALELVGARIPVTTLRAARDGTLPQLMS